MRAAQPLVQVLQTGGGRSAIDGNPMHIRLSVEQFPDGGRVTDRDGIADQQRAAEARHIPRFDECRVWRLLLRET